MDTLQTIWACETLPSATTIAAHMEMPAFEI